MTKITAEELMKRFSMEDHPENGQFVEKHYIQEGEERAASGSIYYYVAPGEKTAFHRIDCDEYWCYVAGGTLDLWQVSPEGELTVTKLGIEEGAEPFVYVKKGMIFGSRHSEETLKQQEACGKEPEGTFLTCITVPRFTYEGFEMFTEEEMVKNYPLTAEFYK
ncbi:MAG: cupin domain-containing protein [Lachnospiraceae bacterium]|nr:cupin domain-containing protein [Lachnospiraceae bacterium]